MTLAIALRPHAVHTAHESSAVLGVDVDVETILGPALRSPYMR